MHIVRLHVGVVKTRETLWNRMQQWAARYKHEKEIWNIRVLYMVFCLLEMPDFSY